MIYTLNVISEPTQEFRRLLDSLAYLPVVVDSLRYSLMTTLYHVDTQINELTLLLTLFRSICRTSSRKVILQRQEIQRKLDRLLQRLKEVQERIQKNMPDARSKVTVTISRAAGLFDFTESQLREWEKRGLLKTERTALSQDSKASTGHRQFTPPDELDKHESRPGGCLISGLFVRKRLCH